MKILMSLKVEMRTGSKSMRLTDDKQAGQGMMGAIAMTISNAQRTCEKVAHRCMKEELASCVVPPPLQRRARMLLVDES